MKIRADEHIAEKIVRLVRDMALSDGWELSHVIEAGQRGTADEHWATQFANDGGQAIISADKIISVRTALVTRSFSSSSGVITFTSSPSVCTSWCLLNMECTFS